MAYHGDWTQYDKASSVSVTTQEHESPRRSNRHSRIGSGVELMLTIPETDAGDIGASRDGEGSTSLLHDKPTSPSLVRKLTTYLKSPISARSESFRSVKQAAPFGSVRRAHGKDYSNLDDDEEDADYVNTDISILEGYEMREISHSPATMWTEQSTAYASPQSAAVAKPDFQSFVSRRSGIGEGLDKRIALQRNSSVAPSLDLSQRRLSQTDIIQRTKTVRNMGQNIAREKNMIVAVSNSDVVDLSVLSGRSVRRRTDHSFDTMLGGRMTTTEDDPKSYYFPQDPDVPNWKPVSMSIPFTVFLAATAIALAGVQEYLFQRSNKLFAKSSGLLAFDKVTDVSVINFFAWKYMPTMVTITYAVLFSIMDFDIRRLEPYYQLSQKHGSTARASMNLDHLTMFQYFVPFKAMRLGQWGVAFSGIGNIVASTIAPALQNLSINFENNPNPSCDEAKQRCTDEGVKMYLVLADPIWSRVLSASYLIVALITITLIIQLRRKSGLLSDPKGIAGIASMATKSHILQDFKGTDTATRAEIHERLAHRRFVLYQSSIWQGEWTLSKEPIKENEKKRLKHPHPPSLRLGFGIPFISTMAFFLLMVPLISLTKLNAIPNKFPWLPILLATLLKMTWTTFEADVRLIEPFYQLSKGNAKPEYSLTLDYQATVYGFLPFIAAWNRHWLVAIVGVCSVALDILSVTVSSFSVNNDMFINRRGTSGDNASGDETTISFLTSVILSMVILGFVIMATCLVYIRRRHPFLPREPSTIAAILAFIYSSKMLDDFIGTERLTSKQMENKLKATGHRYGLGWFRGRDGQIHCAIDQEPMRSPYVHGSRYDQALAAPSATHETYYSV